MFLNKVCPQKQAVLPDFQPDQLATSFSGHFIQEITRTPNDLHKQALDLPSGLTELDPDAASSFATYSRLSVWDLEEVISVSHGTHQEEFFGKAVRNTNTIGLCPV